MELDSAPGIDRLPGGRDLIAALPADGSQRTAAVKIIATLCVVAAVAFTANSAEAKGCLKGAVVGGVAGHYAGHHGVLGAAAGCLYGRHRSKEQQQPQHQPPEQHQSQLPVMDYGESGGM
jgi:hypothetical protein